MQVVLVQDNVPIHPELLAPVTWEHVPRSGEMIVFVRPMAAYLVKHVVWVQSPSDQTMRAEVHVEPNSRTDKPANPE